MCGIWNYYLDKRKTNKLDEHIDIILDYPIEVDYDEYLKVKLCDFKFLNNIHNISSTLQNNQFNIRRYSKTYTYVYGGSELYFDDTGFFNDQNVVIATENIDAIANTDTITNGELSLVYNHELINEISYWVNILNDTPDTSRKMSMLKDYRWFEIISDDNNRITTLDCVFYKDSYTASSTTDVTIKFQRYNESTTAYEDIDSQIITFQNSVPEEQISKTLTFTNPVPTNKYRLIYDTSIELGLPFDLYIIKLQANKQIPIYDSGTIDTPVEHNITIPNGFYKSSSLRTTLNDLLTTYKITTTIDSITNKIKFTNDNPTFVPTIQDLIDDNYQLDLVIPNIQNMKENLGITDSYQQYIPIPFSSYYEGDNHINLINLSKIIITTNLNFQYKTHNEFITGNSIHRGFGNILTWVDCDIPPMSCVSYRNYEDLSYKIENKHITSIRLMFFNEKGQPMLLDNALIHLQIKKLQKKSLY